MTAATAVSIRQGESFVSLHSRAPREPSRRIVVGCESPTSAGWRSHYDWRYGLVGLVLGLAIIVLAIRGHWAEVGWPLGTIVAGSSGFIWQRATPGETRRDGDSHNLSSGRAGPRLPRRRR